MQNDDLKFSHKKLNKRKTISENKLYDQRPYQDLSETDTISLPNEPLIYHLEYNNNSENTLLKAESSINKNN